MKNGEVDWTFDNLSFLVQINPYLQVSLGVASLLISVVLFYVVAKWVQFFFINIAIYIRSTPEELIARRANVITQLVGCVLQSLMYSIILQPIPLYPHRVIFLYFCTKCICQSELQLIIVGSNLHGSISSSRLNCVHYSLRIMVGP